MIPDLSGGVAHAPASPVPKSQYAGEAWPHRAIEKLKA